MFVVTGAAGFIGSNIVAALNARGITDILAVDDLRDGDKFINLAKYTIADYLDKAGFRRLVATGGLNKVQVIFHQGACSDTTERDGQFMMDNNYRYTLELFEYCQSHGIQLIYASSAAVYGAGPEYFEDPAHENPLNVYGYSKLLFDEVLRKRFDQITSQVVGLRYFNVYGPNEQHKGRMASVALHNMNQYLAEGSVRLFGGWDGYPNGGQMRDFIHVDDVVAVNMYFFDNHEVSGIFNCGTGRAQPFNDVALSVINTMREIEGKESLSLGQMVDQGLIKYVDFPSDLKGRYQSYTQANTSALREAGFNEPMLDVQTGVARYVRSLYPNAKSLSRPAD